MYESPLTPTIYIHSQDNDVDFKEVVNKCMVKNATDDGKTIPKKTLNKINNTKWDINYTSFNIV